MRLYCAECLDAWHKLEPARISRNEALDGEAVTIVDGAALCKRHANLRAGRPEGATVLIDPDL